MAAYTSLNGHETDSNGREDGSLPFGVAAGKISEFVRRPNEETKALIYRLTGYSDRLEEVLLALLREQVMRCCSDDVLSNFKRSLTKAWRS